MTWFYLGCCQSDWCGEVTLWQVFPCLSEESGVMVMVRGDKEMAHMRGRGTERNLGQLGLHTGEVTGGSSDSLPWMCSGLAPWDCHNFHALNKTGALNKLCLGRHFLLIYLGDEEIIFKTPCIKRSFKKNNGQIWILGFFCGKGEAILI